MKKFVVFLLMSCLLTGCAAEETMETVADEFAENNPAPLRQMIVQLPEDALAPVSESEYGALYLCDGYEILVQHLPSGDLNRTIREVTGFDPSEVTVLKTAAGEIKRYDLVWSSLGESGEQIGRAAILDDGNYHYVLSVMADAEQTMEYEQCWQQLFASYGLE